MSTTIIANNVVNNDHHREITINAAPEQAAEILKAALAEDITPVEETAPANETAPKKEQAYTPPIPREGDYNGVRMYIEERKKYDPEFCAYWGNHTLKQNCLNLSKIFGWVVDEHSLGANLNRHR